MDQETTDVVVVGGGPVGLLLACELRLGGVDVTVLERLPERTREIRAGAIHVRSIETLQRRGLVERLGDHKKIPRQHFAGLGPLWLDALETETQFPHTLMVPQTEVERALEERARELGVDLRRAQDVTGLSQDTDGVTVEVTSPDGAYPIRAKFLVGCDGGRSTVRKLTGFAFPGSDATVTGRVGFVTMAEPHDVPQGWIRTDRGMLVNGPGPRVVTIEFDGPPPDRDIPVTVEELAGSLRRIGGWEVSLSNPDRLARFSDNARQVEHYRDGRILLAGDAAHVHSPFGGQGLNLGLQDAATLGWKLAATIRGWAPEGLLDTYQTERHPIGERVLQITCAQIALMHPHPRITALRDLFEEMMGLGQVNTFLGELMVGLDVRYDMPGTPASSAPAGAQAEDTGAHALLGRFAPEVTLTTGTEVVPLSAYTADARGLLLDLADDPAVRAAAAGWSGRVTTVTATTDGITGAGAVLVRPDGYVAYAGDEPADLDTALRAWFGTPS